MVGGGGKCRAILQCLQSGHLASHFSDDAVRYPKLMFFCFKFVVHNLQGLNFNVLSRTKY